MKWSTIRPKLLEVFSELSGIHTYWRDRERAFVAPEEEAVCLLHIVSSGFGPGDDDYRYQFNAATQKLDVTQAGIRLFTLSVQVKAYNHWDNKFALEYLEEIRDALWRDGIREGLKALNLAIRYAQVTADLSVEEDDRMVSVATMDVFFAFGNNRTSDEGAPGLEALDWIEKVEGSTPGGPVDADISGKVVPP